MKANFCASWGAINRFTSSARLFLLALMIVLLAQFCAHAAAGEDPASIWRGNDPAGPTLGEALDNTNLVWVAAGFGDWKPQTDVTHDGTDAAEGGPISSGIISQWTTLETTITGPASLSFWWKVAADHLVGPAPGPASRATVKIGETIRVSVSESDFPKLGEGWLRQTLDIPAGAQAVQWSLSMLGGCVDPASATLWLDEVSVSAPGAPAITQEPRDQRIGYRRGARLSVGASGFEPVRYQWYSGATGDCGNPVSGATGPTLEVAPAERTAYWVRVSNDSGAVDSRSAVVIVCPELSASQAGSSLRLLVSADQGTLGLGLRLESSPDLQTWTPVEPADPGSGDPLTVLVPMNREGRLFYRVVETP